jgi:hypothetical protein
MQVWLRKISRLVLLVMLTTVFSPSFGWEAAEAMAPHEHAMSVEHEHHNDAVAAQTLAEDCADAQHHHCCPGHQLGHMQASIVEGQTMPLPVASSRVNGFVSSQFTSYVPEGLERPPRDHFA